MSYNQLRRGRVSLTEQVYHVVTATKNREPHFLDNEKGSHVVRALQQAETDGLAQTLCYVVMPDHLHWLMTLGACRIGRAVAAVKARSARAIGHPVWQENFYDHALRKDEDLLATARYIVANPIRAGLVERIADYPLWGAVWTMES